MYSFERPTVFYPKPKASPSTYRGGVLKFNRDTVGGLPARDLYLYAAAALLGGAALGAIFYTQQKKLQGGATIGSLIGCDCSPRLAGLLTP